MPVEVGSVTFKAAATATAASAALPPRERISMPAAAASGCEAANEGLHAEQFELDLVDGLLLLARADAGAPLEARPVDLGGLVDSRVQALVARRRGVTVLLAGMEAPPNFGSEYTAAFRRVYQDVAVRFVLPPGVEWIDPRLTWTGGTAVWIVNGRLVRSIFDIDFTEGGHDHVYERFAPQTPSGAPDPDQGIREFVVGTGGIGFYTFTDTAPNSAARSDSTYGVLKLTLGTGTYGWQFLPTSGGTFTDSGSGTCH